MAVTYKKLFLLLENRNITTATLRVVIILKNCSLDTHIELSLQSTVYQTRRISLGLY